MDLEKRCNKLENMQSKEKSLNKRIEELENNIKNINKSLKKHSSLEKKINTLNTKTNVLEKYRYLSPQESKDIDQFGFKKEQIVSNIKEKLDKIESSSQRSERLEIITDLFKYMLDPEVRKFIGYFDVFKQVLKNKMIEIYSQEPSRFIYKSYRTIFSERIPLD